MTDYSNFECNYLVDAIQNSDDQKAFEELMKRYSNNLFKIIIRLIENRDDSLDVLQKVWIKIWEKRNSFMKESSFYTWAYRIAKNESLNFLNTSKRKYFVRNSEYNFVDKSIFSNYSNDEIYEYLMQAVSSLPEKQGAVFQLKYFDDLKYNEISEKLNVSEGTLKANYFHAVKKIEEFILNKLNHFE